MVNETMISDHYAVTEYIINEKIKRIQELEATNAELLEALDGLLEQCTAPNHRVKDAEAAVAKAKGAAR